MKTYRVQREWTVIMVSPIEVEADSPEEACRLAMEEEYDDQEIAEGSDGPTYIAKLERDGQEIDVPHMYMIEDER